MACLQCLPLDCSQHHSRPQQRPRYQLCPADLCKRKRVTLNGPNWPFQIKNRIDVIANGSAHEATYLNIVAHGLLIFDPIPRINNFREVLKGSSRQNGHSLFLRSRTGVLRDGREQKSFDTTRRCLKTLHVRRQPLVS